MPSLYALEVWRAMTGRVPSADELQQAAAHSSQATLAWPAPAERSEAIDALEHDLATLRALVDQPDQRARGRAHYILQLNDCLQRSVRERYMRGRKAWSHWDGITAASTGVRPLLGRERLGARRYSLSALQKYALCPYQFLLAAIFRLRPAEDLEPLQRMDPLTRGSLFHEVRPRSTAGCRRSALPLTTAGLDRAFAVWTTRSRRSQPIKFEAPGTGNRSRLARRIAAIPPRPSALGRRIAHAGGEWIPQRFSGRSATPTARARRRTRSNQPRRAGRHRRPLPSFTARSISSSSMRPAPASLRVTDPRPGSIAAGYAIVDGGATLQPVLYSLALEQALGTPVAEGRLYYATTAGGYRDVRIPLSPPARRMGLEVLEIVDRAIENGFLAPAPADKACSWCDFRPVCGPTAERRVGRFKSQDPLADLLELRRKP